jgi:3',5'-nucleoside bisphosphate phosphatase
MSQRGRHIVDLHLHSAESDGTLTPTEIAAAAAQAGILGISITDHDTVAGVPEALEAGATLGITVVPGVELSCDAGGRDIHMLGYFVDTTEHALLETLTQLREGRRHRAERMLEALEAGGYPIGLADVERHSTGGSVGRSHVARAMMDAGYVDTIQDAFARFIGRGRPFFIGKELPPPADVVGLILEAGGLPVLAHPGVSRADDLVPMLVACGLRGIEAYHAEHDRTARARYRDMAASMGLLVTGGSDFHGGSTSRIGAGETPAECLDALTAAHATIPEP